MEVIIAFTICYGGPRNGGAINLQMVCIRGEIIEGTGSEFIGRNVEVITTPQILRENIIALQNPVPIQTTPSTVPQVEEFVLTPLAAFRLGTQHLTKLGTKVLGPRSIHYWGQSGGFLCVRALKEQYQEYVSPQASNRGFVKFEDFIIEKDVIVVNLQIHDEYLDLVSTFHYSRTLKLLEMLLWLGS